MHEQFKEYVDSVHPKFERLMQMAPVDAGRLPPNTPSKGIYLFSEGTDHLYVGRSNRIRTRIQEHSRPSSGHNTAPFAFLLAREATGRTHPSYATAASRPDLEKDPVFAPHFTQSKQRIKGMMVRYVEESDQMGQALLEMYVAVALSTRYNDFSTH